MKRTQRRTHEMSETDPPTVHRPCTGDEVHLMQCRNCERYYETDEQTTNSCPVCLGFNRNSLADSETTDPEHWRADPTQYGTTTELS